MSRLQQVFEALEKNNANASGNFIEHGSEQYVVRGLGLVKDMSDIENIIVATHEHTPIYVRDVAEVKIGAELRQGAVTANGKGEAVAGIVLMLKGASGRDVVNAVKEKLPAIQKALPKGVELVPFYDRTDLVKKAIHTVTKALAGRRDLRLHHARSCCWPTCAAPSSSRWSCRSPRSSLSS